MTRTPITMVAVAALTAASALMFALATTAAATRTVTIATHVSIKSNGAHVQRQGDLAEGGLRQRA